MAITISIVTLVIQIAKIVPALRVHFKKNGVSLLFSLKEGWL